MIKEWLSWLNIIVGGLAAFLILTALFITFMRPSTIPVLEQAEVKSTLPKSAFKLNKEAYDAISEPVLSLKSVAVSTQLPDLKRSLVYYGKNERPDVDPNNPKMQFSFVGNKTSISIMPKEQYYILYDKKAAPPQYKFSPENAETSLWIEVSPPVEKQVQVKLAMHGEEGKLIQVPESNANFTLQEKEFVRSTPATQWEIGKFRVDGTLLARQKAKWFGTDRFLEKHGGKEYQDIVGKNRIDFGEGSDVYSVYVKASDVLIWDNNRWKVVEPGEATIGRPLLVIKKIDERLMNLELWDAEGKSKITLNLLKNNDAITPPQLMKTFKFIGARTRSQFLFEVNKERMILSPQDWLLLTDKGWKKLVTPEEIDAYVDRKTTGRLFVIDSIDKKDDRQVMLGTLFNPSRTDFIPIEIVLQQGATGGTPKDKPKPPALNVPISPNVPMMPQQPMNATPDEDEEEDDEEPSPEQLDEIPERMRRSRR